MQIEGEALAGLKPLPIEMCGAEHIWARRIGQSARSRRAALPDEMHSERAPQNIARLAWWKGHSSGGTKIETVNQQPEIQIEMLAPAEY